MNEVEQYPRDFQEFLSQFKNEEDCRKYLFGVRWPNGFICPKCGAQKYWFTEHDLIHCSSCGTQTSVTSGTLFHGTRKPLLLWFHVMWWVVAQKTGASASNLADFMGLGFTKPHGRGFIKSGVPWLELVEIVLLVL